MKFCVDCKHHKMTARRPIAGTNPPEFCEDHECFHPDVRLVMSVVTGKSYETTNDCSCGQVRSIVPSVFPDQTQGKCGREGRLWEAIPKPIPSERPNVEKGLYLPK